MNSAVLIRVRRARFGSLRDSLMVPIADDRAALPAAADSAAAGGDGQRGAAVVEMLRELRQTHPEVDAQPSVLEARSLLAENGGDPAKAAAEWAAEASFAAANVYDSFEASSGLLAPELAAAAAARERCGTVVYPPEYASRPHDSWWGCAVSALLG